MKVFQGQNAEFNANEYISRKEAEGFVCEVEYGTDRFGGTVLYVTTFLAE